MRRLPVQTLRLAVRSLNVTGDNVGATTCAEFYDARGEFMGGHYLKGVKGKSAWTRVYAEFVMPMAASGMSVSVYVRKGMAGSALFDNVVLELAPVPVAMP